MDLSSVKIPLKPLDQLFAETWDFFKTHFKKLVQITLVMLAPFILNRLFIILSQGNPNPVMILIIVILAILSIISGIWGSMALITFISQPELSVSDAFNQSISLFWSYLWASILVTLIVIGGTILLIVPGIIWSVYFSFFGYVLVCEKIKGYAAAKKSQELVKGYWWAVVGRVIVVSLVYAAVIAILSPINFLNEAAYAVAAAIVIICFAPFSSVYVYQIYQNLRRIKNI